MGKGLTMGHTVLIADDHHGIRDLLRMVLVNRGYEVLVAETGCAAVDLFRQHHPTLAILDVQLPGLSGLDVVRQLHAMFPLAPLFLFTGIDAEDIRPVACALGASEVFQKGLSLQTLVDLIEQTPRILQTFGPAGVGLGRNCGPPPNPIGADGALLSSNRNATTD